MRRVEEQEGGGQTAQPSTAFVCVLLGIAGWVDGVGYVQFGHLFVSFMSGTTTQMATRLSHGEWAAAGNAAALIALFVLGAFSAALVGGAAGRWQLPVVLAIEAALLGAAVVLPASTGALPPAAFPTVLAMGWHSGGLRLAGTKVGLTYVTGTLVNLARGLADALTGRAKRWEWSKDLCLWLAMALGAGAGGVASSWLGLQALAVPAVMVLAFAVVATSGTRGKR